MLLSKRNFLDSGTNPKQQRHEKPGPSRHTHAYLPGRAHTHEAISLVVCDYPLVHAPCLLSKGRCLARLILVKPKGTRICASFVQPKHPSMKYLLSFVAAMSASWLLAQVNPQYNYVQGYYTSDGTYVEGHYRTDPNSTTNDNYSTYPNVNPWTGERGTKNATGAPTMNFVTPVAEQRLFGQGRVQQIQTNAPTQQATGYYETDQYGNTIWVPF